MKQPIKYISLCSGIEAATVAWKGLGWKPAFFSEVDRFPSAVLDHHYPNVENLGDMTNFKKWGDYNANVIVGGTPCQSFSVAGKRAGMDDHRGNLAITYLAIVKRYRPEWVVWENVPGVLSSNGGKDFGSFLWTLGQCGYGWSYRVLDAKYWGVPQRRRRIFVVGYIGGWQGAAPVLFEQNSLHGHPAPSREEGEEVAGTITACSFTGGAGGRPEGAAQNHFLAVRETANTLKGNDDHREDSSNYVIVHGSQDPISGDQCNQVARINGLENVVCFTQNTRDELREMEVAGALSAQPGMKQQSYVREGMTVRRLTPIEAERLQGFPDNYTRIPWRGKRPELCPDGPRYKAIGNSMAVPVMRWIGERICKVNSLVAG